MVSRLFVATPYQPLRSEAYRSMLETNLAGLRRLAVLSGVDIVTNYCFSFEPQTKQMSFEPVSLKPLSEQLTEVSEVCRGLFNARIHRLEQVRRVAVSQYDGQASTDILQGVNVITNRFTGLWTWPYEFTFECFSSELAAALQELNRIPRMLLVKTLNVEPSGNQPITLPPAGAPPPGVPPPPPPPRIPRRGPGGINVPPGAAAPASSKPAVLTTALEEGLLRVVIQVHVIKPR